MKSAIGGFVTEIGITDVDDRGMAAGTLRLVSSREHAGVGTKIWATRKRTGTMRSADSKSDAGAGTTDVSGQVGAAAAIRIASRLDTPEFAPRVGQL